MPLWEQNISMMYMCLYIHTYDYIIYDYTYDYIYIYDYIQQNIVLEKLRNEDEFVAAETAHTRLVEAQAKQIPVWKGEVGLKSHHS